MLGNDISNISSYRFAFRVEGSLILFHRDFRMLFKRLGEYTVNRELLHYMQFIYRKTPYTCCLVSSFNQDHYERKDLLNNIPFNEFFNTGSELEVREALIKGEYDYYVDLNEGRRLSVGSDYAIGLSELSNLLRYR